MSQPYKKKLIELAMPLEAINAASAREKSIRHGHPSTLHLWWARRPLAACRAVLFAQLVDDPSSHPDKFPTQEAVETERKRLFQIIEELVKWENSTNEEILEKARREILLSCDGKLPPVYDPFSGGGSIPLEAQRLGLPAYGSDLNPVAVMIGKAMIEIPSKFKDMEPIHPGIKNNSFYKNAEGLAEDVQFYGEWMRERALDRIGYLYPKVELPKKHGGGKAKIIAWIWTRTVPSPDPAFDNKFVPITSSFLLSSKKGKEVFVEPIVNKQLGSIEYSIRYGGTSDEIEKAKSGTKAARGANFNCLLSGTPITSEYVKRCGKLGKISSTIIATVAAGQGQRIYLPPENASLTSIEGLPDPWEPSIKLSKHPQYMGVSGYGFEYFGDLFNKRQKIAINTFISLLSEVGDEIRQDYNEASAAIAPEYLDDYIKAVKTYLAFAIDRAADAWSSQVTWRNSVEATRSTFSRQALGMVWDYVEVNPFSDSNGNWSGACLEWVYKSLKAFCPRNSGQLTQQDAQSADIPEGSVISTDPPYYDNIPYADISDFFYGWLKKSLQSDYPELLTTISVPKMEELVADRVRHGSPSNAENFFMNGMTVAMKRMADLGGHEQPAAIYYAFRQSEIEQEGTSSTGWASFIEAILAAGLSIVSTWPIRTEKPGRMRAVGANALANSIVLVCRKRPSNAGIITRFEFLKLLKTELPPAIKSLQSANISPADMPQSALGPGIGIFSRYEKILETDDRAMTVKTALQLINSELDEYLSDLQGDFDAETRFAVTWFEQFGYTAGEFGIANNLATARGISVETVRHAGIVVSSAGSVRLISRDALEPDWDPISDSHLTIWECCQYLVREYEEMGENAAAVLIKKIGYERAETVKNLLYYLYGVSSGKLQDAREATAYNGLIAVWSDLTSLASTIHDTDTNRQAAMDL